MAQGHLRAPQSGPSADHSRFGKVGHQPPLTEGPAMANVSMCRFGSPALSHVRTLKVPILTYITGVPREVTIALSTLTTQSHPLVVSRWQERRAAEEPVGGLVPDEGVAVVVPFIDPFSVTLRWTERRSVRLVSSENQRSIRLSGNCWSGWSAGMSGRGAHCAEIVPGSSAVRARRAVVHQAEQTSCIVTLLLIPDRVRTHLPCGLHLCGTGTAFTGREQDPTAAKLVSHPLRKVDRPGRGEAVTR